MASARAGHNSIKLRRDFHKHIQVGVIIVLSSATALPVGVGGVGNGVLGVRYCCGFNPSATNWRHHSAGESRSCAMLMSRGRRPTAARTSLGARKAAKRQRPRRSPSRRFRTVAQPVICDGPIFGRNAGSYCSVESLRHFDPAGCGHSHTVPRCCAFPTLS